MDKKDFYDINLIELDKLRCDLIFQLKTPEDLDWDYLLEKCLSAKFTADFAGVNMVECERSLDEIIVDSKLSLILNMDKFYGDDDGFYDSPYEFIEQKLDENVKVVDKFEMEVVSQFKLSSETYRIISFGVDGEFDIEKVE